MEIDKIVEQIFPHIIHSIPTVRPHFNILWNTLIFSSDCENPVVKKFPIDVKKFPKVVKKFPKVVKKFPKVVKKFPKVVKKFPKVVKKFLKVVKKFPKLLKSSTIM